MLPGEMPTALLAWVFYQSHLQLPPFLLQPSTSADGDYCLPPTAHLLWDVDL